MFKYLKTWFLAKGILYIYKNYDTFLYITNLYEKDTKTPTETTISSSPKTTVITTPTPTTTININTSNRNPVTTPEEIK
jgi:hypothetical protein